MDLTEASLPEELNQLTETVIGGAVEVHRQLGPGLLESVYQEALLLELQERGLQAVTEVDIPVTYRFPSVALCVSVTLCSGSPAPIAPCRR